MLAGGPEDEQPPGLAQPGGDVPEDVSVCSDAIDGFGPRRWIRVRTGLEEEAGGDLALDLHVCVCVKEKKDLLKPSVLITRTARGRKVGIGTRT